MNGMSCLREGDDLLAMKDAYNRGKMGLLDGEKAQTAEEQAAASNEKGLEGIIKPCPWLPNEKDEGTEETIKPYPWSPDDNEDNLGDKTEPYSVSSDEEENEEWANQNNRKELTDKIVKVLDLIMPDIPESNYECYLISADFNSRDNIENEIFQLIICEDGKLKTLRYDGDMVTEN